jgi:hypothetical protein
MEATDQAKALASTPSGEASSLIIGLGVHGYYQPEQGGRAPCRTRTSRPVNPTRSWRRDRDQARPEPDRPGADYGSGRGMP